MFHNETKDCKQDARVGVRDCRKQRSSSMHCIAFSHEVLKMHTITCIGGSVIGLTSIPVILVRSIGQVSRVTPHRRKCIV